MFRFAILAAVVLSASAPARAADPEVTLRIGYLKRTTDLTLAKAHGTREKALQPRGVTITWAGPFPASAPAVEALNGGAVDLTGGSSTSFITSRAGGPAETKHIDNSADWYVENHIIPARPEIARFVIDLSQR